ncbi:HEPN domain-containing protein [Pseudoalteromonas luteoviolacea]|uniref:RiboL-PSP-HEPN domain-containing protein n=1 Tax=Pseudoalteromonas luteoviolacea DSM 6061 TaxID=1365250 RepID=A0A167AY79_9GAMM|nr:HEPN domain-containing protein [Pseudoalteromonas luteoviolacea]KZN45942.1 hypothetical protein N475_25725 [Pseudoalteromonas luteoviolacea DSM 6061]MBE0385404.1 hypothetical protein [Pseudoalteromonas luteoviolacea DSM 6061]
MMDLDKIFTMIGKKTPFHNFRKNLYRIDVIHKISEDLKQNDCDQLDYKGLLLNQAYLIYMVASWQGFVENLAKRYFTFVVYDTKNKAVLKVMEQKMERSIAGFNTPSANGINTLFKEVFGLDNIMSQITSGELDNKKTKKKLNTLLNCRHEIAHEAFCKSDELTDDILISYRKFLLNLAVNLEDTLIKELGESLNGFVSNR